MQRETLGPTRRGGPLFRWLGEPLAIDLANTVMTVREGETEDLLDTPDRLRRWLAREADRLGRKGLPRERFDDLRWLRDATRRVLDAAVRGETLPRADVERLNAASASGPVYLLLAAPRNAEPAAREHFVAQDPVARVLAQLARSAIVLLAGPDLDRLRLCAAPSCGMFYLAATDRQRWCCAACGNRARVARHYERTRRHGGRRVSSRGRQAG